MFCPPLSGDKAWFCFWFCPMLQDWSSGALADFRDTQRWFFLRCKELSLRLLRLMALSLDLDPERFLSAHRLVGSKF